MDQSLIPSNVLERLRHAQGGPEVGGPSVSSLSAQPRIPLQTSSQQYLSPYASANTVFSPLSTTKVLPADNSSTMSNPAFAAKVHEIIARAKANGALEVQRGSVEWNVAREAVIADMKEHGSGGTFYGTTGSTTTSSIEARTARMQGQSPRTASPIALGTIKLDPTVEGTFTASPSGRNRAKGRSNRGGRLRTSKGVGSMRKGKRKRTGAEDGGGDSDDTDSSENFSPLPTQSRSGRKIFQTNTSAPTVKIDEKAALVQPPSSTPRWGSNDSRKKKKASYRRSPSANALCKNCTRGHSPARNVIVFCDGCNTPWHQYCHDPPITGEVVQIEEKDWFCADCTILRAEEEKLEGRIAGEGMSLAEKRQYLQTLPQGHLVAFLLHACSLYPSLPFFAAKASHVDKVARTNGRPEIPILDPDEYYAAEDTLPYPRAGNGIILGPESEDLALLLDDDTVTFSHSWIDKPGMKSAGNSVMGMTLGSLGVAA